jgi:hypothetical protein
MAACSAARYGGLIDGTTISGGCEDMAAAILLLRVSSTSGLTSDICSGSVPAQEPAFLRLGQVPRLFHELMMFVASVSWWFEALSTWLALLPNR